MSRAADSSPPGERYCPMCEQAFRTGERCPTDGTRLVRLAARLDPFLGRELDGQYTILEKLGQGGMGAVYRATQHSMGRAVAIKVVNAHRVVEPEAIKRFLREAKLASRLAHPNAVTVIDFGQTDDGVFYLVMELVDGRTLDQVIEAERAFTPERVVRIGAQVCDALDGAHALRIVHRDLKPSNIMLLSSGRDLIKVLDFGLAKSVAADQAPTTMTGAGALLGTPAFMPPELALGQPCDGRADLYSLGVVLYLLGSGRLPFQAGSAAELIALHGTEPAPPMPGVPPALGRVIDRMLAKQPADRYQTAAEAREALEAALERRHHTPSSGGALDRPRRSRGSTVLAALAAAAIGYGVVAALQIRSTDGPPAPSPASPPISAPAPVVQPQSSASAVPPPAPPSPPVDETAEARSPGPASAELHTPAPARSPNRPGKPPRVKRDRARRPPPTRPQPVKEAPPAPQGSGAPRPELPF